MRTLVSCLLIVGFIGAGCTESTNQKNIEQRTLTPQSTSENQLPGQYIVTLKKGANSETLTSVFEHYGIKSIQEFSKGRYLIILEHDPGPDTITQQAAASSEIDTVQPNYTYQAIPQRQQKSR